MNSDLEKLLSLQDADREIARLRAEIAELPKRVAVIEQKLAATKAQIEKAKGSIAAGQSERRRLEQAIEDQRQKISKYRDQSLSVKTNDQYKALMHEIQFAEQEIGGCEDKILEIMVSAENEEKVLKAAEAELKVETAEIEKEKAEARARTAEDEKQLAEWNARRDQLRSGIGADSLAYYDRVARLRGTGLARVRDHKCTACNVMVRPQTYNEVRTNEQIIACSSCGRIYYYEEETAAGPPTPAAAKEAPAPQM
jgi:predicted  nucleic acid-binding Zn-ribbon protein